jgi:hypothetical protein
MAHPFRKRAYITHCEPLSFCANAAAILTYGKIKDDLADERGTKKLKALLARPLASGMRRKALRKYAELDQMVSNGLKKLSDIEKQRLSSVDIPADAFGEILADIVSYGLEGNDKKIMQKIGKHIGRWIYIVDAADDLDEDIKKQRFNAFACLYDGAIPEEDREAVANSLRLELLAAEPAFDLIDYHELYDIEAIVSNIIYRGMPKTVERVLGINSGKCNDNNVKGKTDNG